MGDTIKKTKLHYAWMVLLGVILIRGFAGGGMNTVSGLFLAPVSGELGVGIGSLSLYLSITSAVTVVWLPFAGRLLNRMDVRAAAVLGALLQGGAFMAFGLLDRVYGWYLLAVPYAMGAALLTNLMGPVLIHRWFSKNAGLMLGILMACVGLFGAVFQPVTSGVIAAGGWREGYLLVGGVSLAAVVLTALLLLRNRPEDRGLEPYGGGEASVGKAGSSGMEADIPEREALRAPAFYLLLLFMVAITGAAVFSQHIPTYGAVLGYPAGAVGGALAFASVGNAVGSIAIGVVSDRIGSLKTCYGILGLGVASVAAFLLGARGFAVFALAALLHGLSSAGIMVLAPMLTLQFFGPRDYEKIFAKVAMGAPLASILLIPAYGFLYDLTGHYRAVLLTMLVLLLLAGGCIALGWRKRCTAAGCPSWRESPKKR